MSNLWPVAKFGEVLRRLVEDTGNPSIRSFAAKAGIAPNTWISAMKANGPADVSEETLEKIARVLEMTPTQLIRVGRGDSGTDAVLRVLVGYLRDPDEWLKKLSEYLRWNPTRARELIDEVERVSKTRGRDDVA